MLCKMLFSGQEHRCLVVVGIQNVLNDGYCIHRTHIHLVDRPITKFGCYRGRYGLDQQSSPHSNTTELGNRN